MDITIRYDHDKIIIIIIKRINKLKLQQAHNMRNIIEYKIHTACDCVSGVSRGRSEAMQK